jgi:hypothetical protein
MHICAIRAHRQMALDLTGSVATTVAGPGDDGPTEFAAMIRKA